MKRKRFFHLLKVARLCKELSLDKLDTDVRLKLARYSYTCGYYDKDE